MKYLLTAVVSLLASPVLAHDGAHLHPHGMDITLTAVLVAVAAVLGAAVFWGVNRK